ncbi:hypothetical protein BOTBODRAFT_320100 [Botryobasidium botryosum FD-172 SS1]|uniref:Uncharacterized protein n=1 Tax=Botryobasidium botryosum (strain FD-172 SS1) TaxID=930990 RepID=A0A067MYN8_BOTB1|nr:hypothetical protein BOTBODRAFT_320100 [Botryobasidium botryosum FD-172 SS1]
MHDCLWLGSGECGGVWGPNRPRAFPSSAFLGQSLGGRGSCFPLQASLGQAMTGLLNKERDGFFGGKASSASVINQPRTFICVPIPFLGPPSRTRTSVVQWRHRTWATQFLPVRTSSSDGHGPVGSNPGVCRVVSCPETGATRSCRGAMGDGRLAIDQVFKSWPGTPLDASADSAQVARS